VLRDDQRVVVSGLGIVAPGATGVSAFRELLMSGTSAVQRDVRLAELGFNCRVSGQCQLSPQVLSRALSELEQRRIPSLGLRFARVAGHEALVSSGLKLDLAQPDPRRSVVFGGAIPGIDVMRDAFALTDAGRAKKLGSAAVEMQMPSTAAAHLAAKLSAGGQVTCNSAACATGTEALSLGLERIRHDQADVVLVGSTEAESPHLWAGFDALRVLTSTHNNEPTRASRPLSKSASGFVPAAGAGALVLERMSHAQARGAHIWCEILGAKSNCGAQLQGGSMTAQNSAAALRCIELSCADADVEPRDVDAISGHLTATQADAREVTYWADALGRRGRAFPLLNAPKSIWGHALTASGSLELVACVLQLCEGFLHASLNCPDLHPGVSDVIDPSCIVRELVRPERLRILAKASFGFGDLNACAILRKL
jgi:3-oxoacyl-(acyl-carrier-protein) synthase